MGIIAMFRRSAPLTENRQLQTCNEVPTIHSLGVNGVQEIPEDFSGFFRLLPG